MQLTILLENTALDRGFCSAHGLSLLIETGGETILFDMGPGAQFAENAQALGVDLSKVDYAVLSHGHYDHGGGLDVFLRRNANAPVYLAPGAFRRHEDANGRDIGLAPRLASDPRLRETAAVYRLSERALLFSAVRGTELLSPINAQLLEDGVPDAFSHEQNLLLEEHGRLFLFGGCAHCGIVNIINRAAELAGRAPDVVVSGFHLAVKNAVPDEFVRTLSARLLKFKTSYYTCHCTGGRPFEILREEMGDRIHALSTGARLTL